MSDKISYVALKRHVLIFLGACVAACSISPKKSVSPVSHPPQVLIIGLDGLSYTTFKKFQDGGHFRNFQAPAPMVSSFPSISDPNWDHLLDMGPEQGYTKAFFDPTIQTSEGMGSPNGSIIAHLSRHPEYEERVDFKPEGPWEHLTTFIWTSTTGQYWLEALERNFFDFSNRNRTTYFSLIINSDLISHTEGELSLMKYLAELEVHTDRIAERYKRLYGKDLEIVIVSDHGNAYFSPQDVPFAEKLKTMGWEQSSSIARDNNYSFFVPEILSFGAFYSQERSKRKLARDISQIDEVQTTMYEMPSGAVRILSHGGNNETQLQYDSKTKTVKYSVIKGQDPFDHARFFKNKHELSAQEYFSKTLDTTYPNALVRIWEGFNVNSKTKPSVLVNPQLGWVFGNATLKLLTNLRGFASCHGSLHRDETNGVLVSTKNEYPAIPPQNFKNFFNVRELKTHL